MFYDDSERQCSNIILVLQNVVNKFTYIYINRFKVKPRNNHDNPQSVLLCSLFFL